MTGETEEKHTNHIRGRAFARLRTWLILNVCQNQLGARAPTDFMLLIVTL
jgi:hypothetical protein